MTSAPASPRESLNMIKTYEPSPWTFRDTTDRLWFPASVPGCVHTDLLNCGKIPDPFLSENELELQWVEKKDWHYRCTFELPTEFWKEQYIELIAAGLDTAAEVSLNGKVVANTDNMFEAHRWEVKRLLRKGRNRLDVIFQSPLAYIREKRTTFSSPFECNDPVGNSARIRKQPSSFGWDWGPRVATSGIWKPLTIEAWSGSRIAGIRVHQTHEANGVDLHFDVRVEGDPDVEVSGVISLGGVEVGSIDGGKAHIGSPMLWWPNGYGEQTLYDVQIKLLGSFGIADSRHLRIGLREISLEMTPPVNKEDSGLFGFRINGRRIFCKGANWIPSDTVLSNLTREHYENLLHSAADAHMNMLRAWGGGIYEHDHFYDLCDELGLLVWQDAMFACSLYPADRAFLKSVDREISQNAERLQHHACIAAWCGNNEIPMIFGKELASKQGLRRNYEALFVRTIPKALRKVDPKVPYLHSSPVRAIPGIKETETPNSDAHDWNVWHARAPITYFETTTHRFVSEFGMQSYPSPELAQKFCPGGDTNIFGPAFENHQKNASGNQIIFDYLSRAYRFPKDYRAIAYLSQINQAECIQRAVQHYRRMMPRCSGTLYWQLNDCWPGASWSSLEYGGKWKALHYAARRFYAQAMISFRHLGAETADIGNYKTNTMGRVELWVVYDGIEQKDVVLEWSLRDFDGNLLSENKKAFTLHPDSSRLIATDDFTHILDKHGRRKCHAWAVLKDDAGAILATEDTLFTAPKFLSLEKKPIVCRLKHETPKTLTLTLQSSTYHHKVWLADITGFKVSDNFFDLPAGETARVTYEAIEERRCREESADLPSTYSLIDSFL